MWRFMTGGSSNEREQVLEVENKDLREKLSLVIEDYELLKEAHRRIQEQMLPVSSAPVAYDIEIEGLHDKLDFMSREVKVLIFASEDISSIQQAHSRCIELYENFLTLIDTASKIHFSLQKERKELEELKGSLIEKQKEVLEQEYETRKMLTVLKCKELDDSTYDIITEKAQVESQLSETLDLNKKLNSEVKEMKEVIDNFENLRKEQLKKVKNRNITFQIVNLSQELVKSGTVIEKRKYKRVRNYKEMSETLKKTESLAQNLENVVQKEETTQTELDHTLNEQPHTDEENTLPIEQITQSDQIPQEILTSKLKPELAENQELEDTEYEVDSSAPQFLSQAAYNEETERKNYEENIDEPVVTESEESKEEIYAAERVYSEETEVRGWEDSIYEPLVVEFEEFKEEIQIHEPIINQETEDKGWEDNIDTSIVIEYEEFKPEIPTDQPEITELKDWEENIDLPVVVESEESKEETPTAEKEYLPEDTSQQYTQVIQPTSHDQIDHSVHLKDSENLPVSIEDHLIPSSQQEHPQIQNSEESSEQAFNIEPSLENIIPQSPEEPSPTPIETNHPPEFNTVLESVSPVCSIEQIGIPSSEESTFQQFTPYFKHLVYEIPMEPPQDLFTWGEDTIPELPISVSEPTSHLELPDFSVDTYKPTTEVPQDESLISDFSGQLSTSSCSKADIETIPKIFSQDELIDIKDSTPGLSIKIQPSTDFYSVESSLSSLSSLSHPSKEPPKKLINIPKKKLIIRKPVKPSSQFSLRSKTAGHDEDLENILGTTAPSMTELEENLRKYRH